MKKGFTLVEVIAVVVILVIITLFMTPVLKTLIHSGDRKEIQIIEERVLNAGREYANNYSTDFYESLLKTGDYNYVYVSDLLRSGLVDESDIDKLVNLVGVKGEVLSNNKVKYTLSYIDNNVPSSSYSNEELYTMIQALTSRVTNVESSTGSNVDVSDLASQVSSFSTTISNLTNKNSSDNVFLKTYPVGSIYTSVSSANPGTIFGGTWISFGAGRTLVGININDTDFDTVEETGGSKMHQHLYGIQMGGYYRSIIIEQNVNAGLINYAVDNTESLVSITSDDDSIGSYATTVNNAVATSTKTPSAFNHYKLVANTSNVSTLQPYITVYMWKRTA